jgi:tetratricopeptide (TPR) repeat protein
MEPLVYAIYAYKLGRFGYRMYARRPYLKVYRPTNRLYQRYYAWKNRPPTPAETANAQNYMRQAFAVIDQDYWDKDKYRSPSKYMEFNEQLKLLTQAAKSMKRARRLDPNATIVVDRDKEKFRYTYDALSAELLYMEALTHFYIAKNYELDARETELQPIPRSAFDVKGGYKDFDRSRTSNAQRQRGYAKEPRKKAITAGEKCLIYAPHHIATLRLLAECYAKTDWTKKRARAAIKKALEYDPNDIDSLQLAQNLGVR